MSTHPCPHSLHQHLYTVSLTVCTSSLSCVHTFVNLSVCDSDCVHYSVVLLMCTVHISVRFPVSLPHLCHLLNYYIITAVNSLDTMPLTWRLGHGTKGISWAQGLLCTCSHRYRHYIYGAAVLLHHFDQGCYQQVSWLTSSSCKCPSNLRTTGHSLQDRRSLTGFIRRPAVKCRYVGGGRDAGILRTGRGGSDRVLPPL